MTAPELTPPVPPVTETQPPADSGKVDKPATPASQPAATPQVVVMMDTAADKAAVAANRVPSNWTILPVDGEEGVEIEATNNATTAQFRGTVAEFNDKYLRAKG